MTIPTPSTGISINAAKIDALAAYLNAETGLNWKGSVAPPSAPDVLVGLVRPYIETPPQLEDTTTELTIQLMLQCKTGTETISDAQVKMLSWQEFIAQKMAELQLNGVSGIYQDIALTNALTGIQPTAIAQGGWTQLRIQVADNQVGGSGQLIQLQLLMNYALPLDHPRINKVLMEG